MTNEEKYNALTEYTQKHGDKVVFGNYDCEISNFTNLVYYPEIDELNLHCEAVDSYGIDDMEATPENINEAITFLKDHLKPIKEFIDFLEGLDD